MNKKLQIAWHYIRYGHYMRSKPNVGVMYTCVGRLSRASHVWYASGEPDSECVPVPDVMLYGRPASEVLAACTTRQQALDALHEAQYLEEELRARYEF